MAGTITAVPTAGTLKSTVFRFDIEDLVANDSTAYDADLYPTEPEVTYYLKFTATGGEEKRSYVFAPNPSDGTHQFNNFIFDKAATWTVAVCKASDNSTDCSTTVVIS